MVNQQNEAKKCTRRFDTDLKISTDIPTQRFTTSKRRKVISMSKKISNNPSQKTLKEPRSRAAPSVQSGDFISNFTNELHYLSAELQSVGWKNMRSWAEFFEKFKPPRSWTREVLDERLTTNMLHFRGNYIVIVTAAACSGILSSPLLLASTVASALVALYLFPPSKSPRVVEVSGRQLSSTEKGVFFVISSSFFMYSTGQIIRILYPAVIAAILCIIHAIFRPRNFQSKFTRLAEESKSNAGAALSSYLNSSSKSKQM